jgi:Ca2+-binding RTX toxin-like protein
MFPHQSKASRRSIKRHCSTPASFESLETRQMMAANAGVEAGVLRVDGSTAADRIIVKAVDRLVTASSKLGTITSTFRQDYLVQVMDTAGNFRNDPAGNPINRYYSRSGITLIEVDGDSGSDTIDTSLTAVSNKVFGRSGNDVISTGSAADSVYGHEGADSAALGSGNDYFSGAAGNDTASGSIGNDSLYGGDNDDRLHGESGHDYIDGENDNDSLTGGSGNDSMYGQAGFDTLSGGADADKLYGSSGNDSLMGDSGSDYLSGSTGADRMFGGTGDDDMNGGDHGDAMYGDAGSDTVSGNAGDDRLNGGTGVDKVYGGSGRDAIIGGQNNDPDYLEGGTGQDRFLEWSSTSSGSYETRADLATEDAVIYFRNSSSQTVTLGSNIGETDYSAGSWTQSEIEAADDAFIVLQNRTNNTKMLKTNWGFELTFHRAGSPTSNIDDADTVGGWNSGGGSVTITQFAAGQGADNIMRVVTHEIGHNWDDESPFYNDWKNLSGWEMNIPGWHDLFPPEDKVKSDDGNWWRDEDADFAREYGEMNPLEDFATMWEAYFGYNGTPVAAKVAHLDMFFNHMSD